MMENENIDERQVPAPSSHPVTSNSPAVQASKSSGTIRAILFAGAFILILANVVFLYITNSRVNDLEARIFALAGSPDSRNARPPAPSQPGGADSGKNYEVNIEGAPVNGPDSAPVTIVEASDFQCPYCAKVRPALEKVQEVYKDKVRIVWKHLPLTSIHPDAMGAATAAEAAKEQGKFWEYQDKLFDNQKQLTPPDLKRYAAELGLNIAKFESDMADPAIKKRVTDDVAEINGLGVTGTPGFFINGRFLNGAQPFESFAAVINGELKKQGVPVPQ